MAKSVQVLRMDYKGTTFRVIYNTQDQIYRTYIEESYYDYETSTRKTKKRRLWMSDNIKSALQNLAKLEYS